MIPSALAIMAEVDFFFGSYHFKVINRRQNGHIALHGLHVRDYVCICCDGGDLSYMSSSHDSSIVQRNHGALRAETAVSQHSTLCLRLRISMVLYPWYIFSEVLLCEADASFGGYPFRWYSTAVWGRCKLWRLSWLQEAKPEVISYCMTVLFTTHTR